MAKSAIAQLISYLNYSNLATPLILVANTNTPASHQSNYRQLITTPINCGFNYDSYNRLPAYLLAVSR